MFVIRAISRATHRRITQQADRGNARENKLASRINSEGVKMMSRRQRGEVMVAVMLVVLLVAMVGRGHMGMMGHGHDGKRQDAPSEPASTSQTAPTPAKATTGHQH